VTSEAISPGRGATLVKLLLERTGIPTTLHLEDGAHIVAHNCAWGRDFGNDWEHLSLNVSPEIEGVAFEVVSGGEVAEIIDPASGEVLYRRPNDVK